MRTSDLIRALTHCYNSGERGGAMVDAALIGRVIQRLRRAKGMSQEVLSGLAGLDRTHYSKIERGLRSPTIDTLFNIAQALDMAPHEIVSAIEKALEAEETTL